MEEPGEDSSQGSSQIPTNSEDPAETPAITPANTPANTPAETPADTPTTHTPMDTPSTNTPQEDTPLESSEMESDDKDYNNSVDSEFVGSRNHAETSQDSTRESGEDGSPDVIVLDSDDDDENYTNPEPPKEIVADELLNADIIGDTAYSKHWLFTTLMNLIKAVDAEENSKCEPQEGSEYGLDLDESLQDELCKLWDMSMNPAVVSLLMDFKAIDLLTGVVTKSKAPRAMEICVGILGNMACTEVACKAISVNDKLRTMMLVLLDSPDAPTLVETTRLLYTCMSCAAVYDLWMTSVRDTPSVYNSLIFILSSSTNNDLLSHTADLIDKVMDTEDDLLIEWSSVEMVQAVLEAVKQCRSSRDTLDTFLHILQLISTCDSGVESLGCHSASICELTLQYIKQLCGEDILVLDGQENALGCVLCVLSTTFQALEDKSKLLVKDYQLMRCLLKILYTVYPRVRQFTPGIRKQNSRSDSSSETRRNTESPPEDVSNPRTDSDDKDTGSRKCSESESRKCTDTERADQSSEGVRDNGDAAPVSGSRQGGGEKKQAAAADAATLEMLYEVLQNILTDLVLLLSEENEMSSLAEVQDPEDDEDSKKAESSQSEERDTSHDSPPKTLTYLNELCERDRLRVLVYTLDEVLQDTEMDCCARLKQAAQNHKYSRLEKIVDEYSAG